MRLIWAFGISGAFGLLVGQSLVAPDRAKAANASQVSRVDCTLVGEAGDDIVTRCVGIGRSPIYFSMKVPSINVLQKTFRDAAAGNLVVRCNFSQAAGPTNCKPHTASADTEVFVLDCTPASIGDAGQDTAAKCTRDGTARFAGTISSVTLNVGKLAVEDQIAFRAAAANKHVVQCAFSPKAGASDCKLQVAPEDAAALAGKPREQVAANGTEAAPKNACGLMPGAEAQSQRCSVGVNETASMADGEIAVRLLSIDGTQATMDIYGRPQPFLLTTGDVENFSITRTAQTFCLTVTDVSAAQQTVEYVWKETTHGRC